MLLGTSPQGMLTVETVTDEHDCGASSLGKQALSARNFFPESDEDKKRPSYRATRDLQFTLS